MEYHGVVLEEMDLDAMLTRKPMVCLVDELAHTNAPGSRNAKRYQDVEELLRAGINVITTLNIQHLESLRDIMEQATGVKVKERLPDYVVGLADQLVNVDLSAEDLRERLQAGKIYPEQRIESAMQNFFTHSNLTQLRELAMEEIAHRLDRRRQEEKEGPIRSGSERVMVSLSSRGPNPAALLARREPGLSPTASGLRGTPFTFKRRARNLDRVDAGTHRRIHVHAHAGPATGRHAVHVPRSDVVNTIAAFVQEYGITHIVMGRTWTKVVFAGWFRQSVLDRLLSVVPGVDVLVTDTSGEGIDSVVLTLRVRFRRRRMRPCNGLAYRRRFGQRPC